MKTELNKKNNQTTVVIDVSYAVENKIARDFVKDEHATVFYNLKDDGILRFEWYLNEDDKTGTLIEVFDNSQVWEEVGNKLIGSPVNLRLRELFTIEKITVLGEISDEFKEKLKQMSSPVVKSYVGGIRQE
tara:strand:+ start:634 stop:1026 length:393 start_codon:yes stop_codon:yes gene_type:complete